MESLKPLSFFRMVPSLTPYNLPLLPNGVPRASKIREWPFIISATGNPIHFMFGISLVWGFRGRRI